MIISYFQNIFLHFNLRLEPTRKSSRLKSANMPVPAVPVATTIAVTTPDQKAVENVDTLSDSNGKSTPKSTVTPITRELKEKSMSLRKVWDEQIGSELFDIKSQHKIQKCVKQGYCFDLTFYEDQKEKRNLRMMVTKVTNDFKREERERMQKEARTQARRSFALGNKSEEISNIEVFSDAESQASDGQDTEWEENYDEIVNTPHINTRQSIKRRLANANDVTHVSTQTEVLNTIPLDIPVRVKKNERKAPVEPRYLEAMGLLMSENLSASEALKAVHVVDTVVWGQTRHLPLRLDKGYMNAHAKLKKLVPDASSPSDCSDDQQSELLTLEESVEQSLVIDTSSLNENDSTIKYLTKIANEGVKLRNEDPHNTLPDVACVRQNHHLMSVYCEQKIGVEILDKKSFIVPDGTSRQGVGDIAGMVVKVGDKIRALKSLQITKGLYFYM